MRLRLSLTYLVWTIGFALMPSAASAASADRDCNDFANQSEAQAFFEGQGDNEDRLDADGDGQACEWGGSARGDGIGWWPVLVAAGLLACFWLTWSLRARIDRLERFEAFHDDTHDRHHDETTRIQERIHTLGSEMRDLTAEISYLQSRVDELTSPDRDLASTDREARAERIDAADYEDYEDADNEDHPDDWMIEIVDRDGDAGAAVVQPDSLPRERPASPRTEAEATDPMRAIVRTGLFGDDPFGPSK